MDLRSHISNEPSGDDNAELHGLRWGEQNYRKLSSFNAPGMGRSDKDTARRGQGVLYILITSVQASLVN